MVTTLVALALLGVVGGAYYLITRSREATAAEAPELAFERPTERPAASRGASAHPYAKHLEITGFRVIEVKQRPQLRFVVVNHSGADLASSSLTVTIRTAKSTPDEPAFAVLKVQTPQLGAYESKEMTSALNTKLRAYELPDWQFLRAEVEFNE